MIFIANSKIQKLLVSTAAGLLAAALAFGMFIMIINNRIHMDILNDSVKSNLISISIAAREFIDADKFESYDSLADVAADAESYARTLFNLRSLAEKVGATYIYALKEIGGEYYFIFDTDTEDEEIFVEYELSPVHEQAFMGMDSADVMNVVDVYGNFNTGAVPIIKNGSVIGIICTDIEDEYVRRSRALSTASLAVFIAMLTGVMAVNVILIRRFAIKPISRLTESVTGHIADKSAIYGTDRDDEIGGLARKISEMTGDVESALAEAQAASRAKSDFLANMSHEIRTPMNAIIGMTNIAKTARNAERKDYALGKIENASNHLLGVINDILDMSKIEADKLELHASAFVFGEMINKAVGMINFRVAEKRQRFDVIIGENIPRKLSADDHRLAQVLTNLLSNAVKFTPENGAISLTASLEEEKESTCSVRFEITDTGAGIAREQQARLFNPFEQAESGTQRKFGGTGLGLPITKRIVELMGGSLSLKSAPGEGSSFIFTIPFDKTDDDGAEAPEQAVRTDASDIRALVVDDDEDILEYFTDLAARFGVACDTASSGVGALRLIESGNSYGICFVDWKMPGMDGIEFARRARETGAGGTVFVMISSYEWRDAEAEAKDAGITKFLPKPFYPEDFIECVNTCLGADLLNEKKPEAAREDRFWGYRALLAEDIEINREIVTALLEPTFIEIECAENGEQALKKFSEAPDGYNIIFMDLQMPVMDGYEAARGIRALGFEKARTVPIIAMTANVFTDDIANCLAAGMNGHIGKPLDFEVVLKILRKYLYKQKPAKERRREERRKTGGDRRESSDRRKTDRRKDE